MHQFRKITLIGVSFAAVAALGAACAQDYGGKGGKSMSGGSMGENMAMAEEAAMGSAAEMTPPFSGPQNVAYAGTLWSALEDEGLVGPNAIVATPYEGQEPHGAILITMEREISVAGHRGLAIVKKNYVGDNVTTDTVANAPDRNLDSVTVMFQREAGYDPDHDNWFWSKHNPDGSLQSNPKGMKLAGRVAKGAAQGCIACHQGAPGGDYVFNHDRLATN